MAHVFISYTRADAEFVDELIPALTSENFKVWVDRKNLKPGEAWGANIDEAIRAAFVLLVVVTPEAMQSQYVTYEWSFACGIGVEIIPLMVQKTPLHPKLDALQWVNFSRGWNTPLKKLIHGLTEAELRVLSRQIKHVSWKKRLEAVERLGQMSADPAISSLLEGAAQDKTSKRVKEAAKAALARWQS